MGVDVDNTEVAQFAVVLGAAGARVLDQVRPVIARGALNIKRQQQAEMAESPSFRPVARAISYDITETRTGVQAEIGPRKGSPGSLANIAYFGSPSRAGGATVPDPLLALEAEAPNVVKFLEDIIGDLP